LNLLDSTLAAEVQHTSKAELESCAAGFHFWVTAEAGARPAPPVRPTKPRLPAPTRLESRLGK